MSNYKNLEILKILETVKDDLEFAAAICQPGDRDINQAC